MPSPFPGMDPFIEGQRWHGFHSKLINALGDVLVSRLRPRYVVDVEEFVFLTPDEDDEDQQDESWVGPDVSVAEADANGGTKATPPAPPAPPAAGVTTVPRPVVRTIPLPRRRRQHYLVLRRRDGERVVTVVELLSPKNKKAGDGQADYLTKRYNVLHADANLVELDLLRGGARLPTVKPLPAGDYFAFVCRNSNPSRAEVYAWSMRRRLPAIPIPLGDDDPDVVVDLQLPFTKVYDAAGYDYALKYARDIVPPLGKSDAAWVRHTLAGRLPQPASTPGR